MGVSTDGIICFGIQVAEEAELPWDKYDDKEYDWWQEVVLGYVSPYDIVDEDGDWKNGVTEEEIDAWYEHSREFQKNSPQLPVEVILHCSYKYPMYIIADKKSVLKNSRGYPQRVDANWFYMPPDRIKVIEDFVEKYKIETEGEIGWWLVSLWG